MRFTARPIMVEARRWFPGEVVFGVRELMQASMLPTRERSWTSEEIEAWAQTAPLTPLGYAVRTREQFERLYEEA